MIFKLCSLQSNQHAKVMKKETKFILNISLRHACLYQGQTGCLEMDTERGSGRIKRSKRKVGGAKWTGHALHCTPNNEAWG